jgi:trehalose 6-phosphate synthase/phosphatase
MDALRARITRNDAVAWGERFIVGLRAAAASRARERPSSPPAAPVGDIVAAFRRATQRVLCLDYDGTLVPLAPRPRDAAPGPGIRELLAALTGDPGTNVVVVSGRSHEELDAWLGDIPRLWLAAEHGALLRHPGEAEWTSLHPGADVGWKDRIRPLLREFADRAPGALVEEKATSLAWHYRLVDPEFGGWLANELATTLDSQLGGTDLAVLHGSKVVEVRFAWATKGEVVGWLGALGVAPDFQLALGDDRTDEDLFARLPADAWTIHVGPGPTRARYSVGSTAEARGLLGLLAERRPA